MTELEQQTETVSSSELKTIEFRSLKESMPAGNPTANIVREFGKVYVTSMTRQGCSGCEEQKPLFRELATRMARENEGKVQFTNIHVQYRDEDKSESWESKRLFGHAAYPTYMIYVKSQAGPLEVFRKVYPSMEELEKQIEETFELAEFYKTEAEKTIPPAGIRD